MKVLNLLYWIMQKEFIVANVSSYLSRREIDNVSSDDRLHYFSSKKAMAFLEAIGIEVPIDKKGSVKRNVGYENHIKAEVEECQEISYKISLESKVLESIEAAEEKGIIVPYEKCRRGKYVLIHFPFYNGTMMLKTCKKYDNVYWWCGKYRDLKVYACGNKGNRIDDISTTIEPLWDPSAGSSSKEFFDEIDRYVAETTEENIIVEPSDLFEKLSSNLHEGTMRGNKKRPYQGWYVMLLRCDCVRKKHGYTEIFGSPVYVSYETMPGYGWYYAGDDDNKEQYIEYYGKRGYHCLVMSEPKTEKRYEKIRVRNKGYIGHDYGYQLYEGRQGTNMRITKQVRLTSKEKSKCVIEEADYDEVTSSLKGLKAVGLTTRELTRNIQKK